MAEFLSASFLLIKSRRSAFEVANFVGSKLPVRWVSPVYGPYQVVAYVSGNDERKVAEFIEMLRSEMPDGEVDARLCKASPGDESLGELDVKGRPAAVLLINVNYAQEKERIVTYRLRELKGVAFARAMWGPADIIAIVNADDHESLRNLICDDIKTLKGVATNTTLYGYPRE
jgi:hypothetical protein